MISYCLWNVWITGSEWIMILALIFPTLIISHWLTLFSMSFEHSISHLSNENHRLGILYRIVPTLLNKTKKKLVAHFSWNFRCKLILLHYLRQENFFLSNLTLEDSDLWGLSALACCMYFLKCSLRGNICNCHGDK